MNSSKHNNIPTQGESQGSSAEPHPRDGHIRLPNEVVEKLARVRFNQSQWQIIVAVCRKTLGWQKPGEWKNLPHPISFGDLSKATGLKRSQVARETMDLVKRYVLVRDRNGYRPSNTKLNLNYSQWKVDDLLPPEEEELPPEVVPQQRLVPEERPGSPSGETMSSPSGEARIVPQERLPLASKSYLRNKPKQRVNKHAKENVYTDIFDSWNSLKIIQHKQLTSHRRALKSALENYTQEEICQAMRNYAEIVHGDDYYFDYRWTLKDFLQRGLEKFMNGDVARHNYTIREGGRDGTRQRMPPQQKGVRPKPDQGRLHPYKRTSGN